MDGLNDLMRFLTRRFCGDRRATSALEFAMIAPVFFLLIFGITEIGLIVLFSAVLGTGADGAADYLRTQRISGQPITDAGIRTSVCSLISAGGLSCDAGKLKIGLYYAGVPSGGNFGVPKIIDNVSDPRGGSGGQYVIALGYNWDVYLPTSKMLLPVGSGGPQIQARAYTVLAERVWDDGAGH